MMHFRAAAFPHSGLLVSPSGAIAIMPGYWLVVTSRGLWITGGLN